MSDISRVQIEEVIRNAVVDAETAEGRNQQRREAVEEFLSTQPDGRGTQGTVHDMILSDLKSYPGWENAR